VEVLDERIYPVHRPESGYRQFEEQDGEVPVIESISNLGEPYPFTVTELIIRYKSTNERQLVHYWYKTGGLSTNSQIRHELHMLVNNIFNRGASNSLLRISTNVLSNDPRQVEAARARVRDFCQTVFPYTIAAMP
jgi:EpsI family protein